VKGQERLKRVLLGGFVLLLLLCVTARFIGLRDKFFWVDEVYTSLAVAGVSPADARARLASGAGRELDLEFVREMLELPSRSSVASTVRDLWEGDPHHCPLYFALAHVWGEWVGFSPFRIRLFSVLLSLLAFPVFWLLSRELLGRAFGAGMAVVLFSVSPFFLIYSQQAREYGLWTVLVCAWGYGLLKACRRSSGPAWMGYGFLLLAALYTDLFSIPVWIGQAVWCFRFHRQDKRILSGFLIASLGAFVLFSPWLIHAVLRIGQIHDANQFQEQAIGAGLYWQTVLLNFTRIFWDTGRESYLALPWSRVGFVLPLAFLLFALFHCAVAGWKVLSKRSLGFLAAIGLPIPVLLMAWDLAAGGKRALVPRYLIPFWIALLLLLAAGIEQCAASGRRSRRLLATLAVLTLVGFGSSSSIRFLSSSFWWTTRPVSIASAVPLVRSKQETLPVVVVGSRDPVPLIALSFSLPGSTPFRVFRSEAQADSWTMDQPFLLYAPSRELAGLLSTRFRAVPVVPGSALWLARPVPRTHPSVGPDGGGQGPALHLSNF
jgi:uncharacterized membrane protein